MCTLYVFIDASTDAYEEEEEVYEEEEEEHCANCANCTNQGKLIPLQEILVQASKDTLAIYFIQGTLPIPSFYLASFYLSKSFYSLPLSESSITTSVSKFSIATQT